MSAVAGVVVAMLAASPQVSQQGRCADTSVEQAVAGLLEAKPVDGSGWRVRVEVVEEDGPLYVANIEIEDPEGGVAVRSVSSPSCEVAIDAVAFIVATALAEESLLPEPEPEAEPEAEPEPEPLRREDPEPAPTTAA